MEEYIMSRRLKSALLIFLFLVTNIYADTESYVLKNDAPRYSKEFRTKLMIRIFEKRAHVYTVFGKYDLAVSYLKRAEQLIPSKHEYYVYLMKEIINKKRLEESLEKTQYYDEVAGILDQNAMKIKVKTASLVIKVRQEQG